MASILNQTFDDDEDSETEFNPGVEQGSDDEQDTKPATTNGRSSASPARRRSPKPEDSDDEKLAEDNGEDDEGEGEDLDGDDDDEEEEEDEEDEGIRSRPRKRRRGGLGAFFEEEAEVDEDDDDVEGDEEGLGPEFIEETHPDDDLPVEADQDDRRHRELDRKRQLEASMDAEKQAAEFRERYGRRTATSMGAKNYMPQNLLMPDVSDPSIFAVKCREGKEKEIVQSINRKFFQRQTGRDPMKIFSAFERGEGAMKGYIFVEARNKADVENGLNGVHDVYPHSKMNLVPMKEMPDLLRVMKSKELEPGAYVRIRKGLYTGDLAVVEDAVPNGLDVLVKLVPRLTYGLDEDQNHSATPDAKRKRPGFGNPAQNLANRPPARLFNESQAKQRHARFLQQFGGLTRKEFQYRGDKYEDGFLIKNFKINQLTTENVQPKLEETQLFTSTGQDGAETLDLETLKRSLHDKSTAESSYQVGDEVEVFSGEQKGAIGRTERVTGNIVSIRVSEGELKDQLVEVPVRSLRKIFNDGDNVVVGGASKYRDQVGTVIAIENDKVTILSHDNQMEFTVFSKDLRIASGAGASTERSPFEVRDLVHLTATTFGCVVSADPQTVKVMDQNGSIETRLPSALSKVMQSRNVVAVDKNGSEIRPGDMVKEVGGEGKSGSILHIYRNFIYAHDRTRMIENAGIWVARSSNVIGRSSRSGAGLTDLSKMNPALAGKAPNGAPMAPPQRPGIDRLIRKKVKITKGPYKGHRGTVKDTTISEARVELESKNKTVNIDKGQLSVIEYVHCRTDRFEANKEQSQHRPINPILYMGERPTWHRRCAIEDASRPRIPIFSCPGWCSHTRSGLRRWSYPSMGLFLCANTSMGRSLLRHGGLKPHSFLASTYRLADLLRRSRRQHHIRRRRQLQHILQFPDSSLVCQDSLRWRPWLLVLERQSRLRRLRCRRGRQPYPRIQRRHHLTDSRLGWPLSRSISTDSRRSRLRRAHAGYECSHTGCLRGSLHTRLLRTHPRRRLQRWWSSKLSQQQQRDECAHAAFRQGR
jgi:transcription elongation factor SPT5